MTEHGACIRCHRPSVLACYHRKNVKEVVARLCHMHRRFAPKKTTLVKLIPLPPEPDEIYEDQPETNPTPHRS